jgi:putative Holliday junction resolvase
MLPGMPDPVASGVVLAFDFGLKRIGVAIGENLLGRARALTTLPGEARALRFAAIEKLIEEWQPVRLVVGLPFNVDGSEHEMTEHARRFARQLSGRFGLDVTLVDERYTSLEAEAELKHATLAGRKPKPGLDAAAAMIILQSYFNDAARC